MGPRLNYDLKAYHFFNIHIFIFYWSRSMEIYRVYEDKIPYAWNLVKVQSILSSGVVLKLKVIRRSGAQFQAERNEIVLVT
jgi:hypothetical protein